MISKRLSARDARPRFSAMKLLMIVAQGSASQNLWGLREGFFILESKFGRRVRFFFVPVTSLATVEAKPRKNALNALWVGEWIIK